MNKIFFNQIGLIYSKEATIWKIKTMPFFLSLNLEFKG